MFSFLLILSMSSICQGLVLPPDPECTCINPFVRTSQPFLGNKTLTCLHTGACYVSCEDSACGDVQLATGFTAKEGRCLSKAACHVVVEEKLFSKFALSEKEKSKTAEPDESVPQPTGSSDKPDVPPSKPTNTKFVLSGLGPVTSYQGHSLGLYIFNTDVEYYEQEGGDYYLMQDRGNKEWFTFPHISGCDREKTFSCIAQYAANLKTENVTLEDWSFGKDQKWTKDDSIKFGPLDSDSCLLCSTILLTSTGPAVEANPQYFGTFNKVNSTFSAGRPVYQNKEGKFLMMKNEYTTFSVWDDMERTVRAGKGEDSSRAVRSLAGPICVTQLQLGSPWQFVDENGEWQDDKNISGKCVE